MQPIRTLEALVVKVEMIHEDIKDLSATVKALEEDLNRRRGALRALCAVTTGLTGLIAWVITHIKL
jgi:hypothetical protein